ncbi:histidinol-phosphatase HisJ [Indiicoccus explosivorum]|uniref:histidinol-phosphatase HisJ n=1 Tax=Indiicoccus explosivorum TaxID=1917864 RepID=UPI000B445ABC|nr:histidinol-phosphatase HisJ [Indiicoccus explosivorum]
MLTDGHVHSPFCPHGTDSPMEDYVKKAVSLGLEAITFTEHAPLPAGFTDPVPEKDSAMRAEDVPAYLAEGRRLAQQYKGQIDVRTGFEVDYIEGFEKETEAFLSANKGAVPHSVLSVHFLKLEDGYFCLDYSADLFEAKAEEFGAEALYRSYERTLRLAAGRPFGSLTPPVIGHVNLIHKFRKRVPADDPIDWEAVLRLAKTHGRTLDYNFAGLNKADYGEAYPDADILKAARLYSIPLQTGSDAHHPDDVGRYFAGDDELGKL